MAAASSDRDALCEAFIETLAFDPYPFQEEAILGWFACEGGMLVSAPTGMGKTLVAETAVFEALQTRRRLYYTTPLIALTDQKLAELQDRVEAWGFARDDVGLLTGNRKLNPDAPILVVVAEILLNHLLSRERPFDDVCAVVMDEFHWFNDRERGVVWELSLAMLPPTVRVLLLSATVGNALDFVLWMRDRHERRLALVQTNERKVPLEVRWIEDELFTDHLASMVGTSDEDARIPALVFCFSRDECWEIAERLKGLPLIPKTQRPAIEARLEEEDFGKGAGAKLRQMLIRGVGVHHAGILPRYKAVVERLFLEKLVPFVICTETLAAGVNLPARSVVMRTLLKGKPGERTLIPASDAHQMFGRAGRPQFDARGYVDVVAHDDDVKIARWRKKYDQLDPRSTNPVILRMRKELERKRPSRRKTEQYWSKAQLEALVAAGPARLGSRAMIPYRFLIHVLLHDPDVDKVRAFLQRRFNSSDRLASFERQLDVMVGNLQHRGYLHLHEDGRTVALEARIEELLAFRSIHPLYGAFLSEVLVRSSYDEKVLALESVLPVAWRVARACEPPPEREPGPLQRDELEPLMISMGVVIARKEPTEEERERARFDVWADGDDEDARDERPPTFPEMLGIAFDASLPAPEEVEIQTKWIAGGLHEARDDFYGFVGARQLAKNEGLVLRHVLRVVLLADEFAARTGDPDYALIAERATRAARAVDARYTERFLDSAAEQRELGVA